MTICSSNACGLSVLVVDPRHMILVNWIEVVLGATHDWISRFRLSLLHGGDHLKQDLCLRVAKTCRKPSDKNTIDCEYVCQMTIIHLLRSYPRNLPHSGSVRFVLKTKSEKCLSNLDARMLDQHSHSLRVMPSKFQSQSLLIYLNTAVQSTAPRELTM